jgi:hypothetical protein
MVKGQRPNICVNCLKNSVLTDAPVVLLRAEEAMENDDRSIASLMICLWRFVEMVRKAEMARGNPAEALDGWKRFPKD